MGSPAISKINNNDDDPKEKEAAILSFLKTFNRIYNLGEWRYNIPEIEYALSINRVRRILVATIHLSALWPSVLEWAYEKSADIYRDGSSRKSATGLYHLLRNGMASRPSLVEPILAAATTTIAGYQKMATKKKT